MLKEIFEILAEYVDGHEKERSVIEKKIVAYIDEIDELEEEYADALANAERWGDLTDESHWRTVKVNKLKRNIQAKERMIEKLKDNS